MNVGAFVRDDVAADAPWYEKIDWKEYRRVVRLATHFLDNVIDANQYPLPEIHDLAQHIRRIGLGVMGFADLLVRLGVPYDSEEGVEVGRRIMEFMDEEAKKESERLAEAARAPSPSGSARIWGPDETLRARARTASASARCAGCATATWTRWRPRAPSRIIAGCSSGIEPLFAVAFMRNQAGALMPDVNEDFVRVARERGFYSEELMKRIAEEGHIHFPEVPEDVQRVFVTAHDITPEWHVRMQAAFQEYVDSAISQDHQLPARGHGRRTCARSTSSPSSWAARASRCTATASRDDQVLSTGATRTPAAAGRRRRAKLAEAQRASSRSSQAELKQAQERIVAAGAPGAAGAPPEARAAPRVLQGTTRKMTSPLGDVFVTINEDEKALALRGLRHARQGGLHRHGRHRGHRPPHLAGAALRRAHRRGAHAAARHLLATGPSASGRTRCSPCPTPSRRRSRLREQEKAGIQQELIPELAVAAAAPTAQPQPLQLASTATTRASTSSAPAPTAPASSSSRRGA